MAIRVFLSSKMQEFDQERAAIAYQISTLFGFDVTTAEEWGARSDSVRDVYIEEVRRCHIYVGLFGRVYSAATRHEYDEAATNPYRPKLIYIKKGSKRTDPELAQLIRVFEVRHRPYRFDNLRDLQPQLLKDLLSAVTEMTNHVVQLGQAAPVAHSDTGPTVAEESWRNQQRYLHQLFANDPELTEAYLEGVRANIRKPAVGLLRRILDLARTS